MRKIPVLTSLILVGVLLISLSACSPVTTASNPPGGEPQPTPPPAAGQATEPEAGSGTEGNRVYPAPTALPTATPAPAADPYPASAQGSVAFTLDRPLSPGITTVSGSGLAGVPVRVLLEDGTALGKLVIGDDGRFELQVPALESGQRVGLMLDDLTGTSWNPDELITEPYHGPGSVNIPALGFFLDTVLVQ